MRKQRERQRSGGERRRRGRGQESSWGATQCGDCTKGTMEWQ